MLKGKRLLEKVRPYAKRMHAASHEFRVAILFCLAHGPMEAGEIAKQLDIAENLVSFHLKHLHTNGWILKTRQGRFVTYQLNERAFIEFDTLFLDTPFEKEVLSRYRK